jgi:hypothetical protein
MGNRVAAKLSSVTEFIQDMLSGETFYDPTGRAFLYSPADKYPFVTIHENKEKPIEYLDIIWEGLYVDTGFNPVVGTEYEFSNCPTFPEDGTITDELTFMNEDRDPDTAPFDAGDQAWSFIREIIIWEPKEGFYYEVCDYEDFENPIIVLLKQINQRSVFPFESSRSCYKYCRRLPDDLISKIGV